VETKYYLSWFLLYISESIQEFEDEIYWESSCISILLLQQILYQVVYDKVIIKSQQFSCTQFYKLTHKFIFL